MENVLAKSERTKLKAVPVDGKKPASSWQTAAAEDAKIYAGLKGHKQKVPIAPFYSMYNISDLTFAKFRVAWKRMASQMAAVVLSNIKTEYGMKRIISTDTTSLFAATSKEEAHYLCAVLNSDLVDRYIRSFSEAGRGFGAPSIMNNLAIPKFNTDNKTHLELAALSEQAHGLVQDGKPVGEIREKIIVTVKKLWNIA